MRAVDSRLWSTVSASDERARNWRLCSWVMRTAPAVGTAAREDEVAGGGALLG